MSKNLWLYGETTTVTSKCGGNNVLKIFYFSLVLPTNFSIHQGILPEPLSLRCSIDELLVPSSRPFLGQLSLAHASFQRSLCFRAQLQHSLPWLPNQISWRTLKMSDGHLYTECLIELVWDGVQALVLFKRSLGHSMPWSPGRGPLTQPNTLAASLGSCPHSLWQNQLRPDKCSRRTWFPAIAINALFAPKVRTWLFFSSVSPEQSLTQSEFSVSIW